MMGLLCPVFSPLYTLTTLFKIPHSVKVTTAKKPTFIYNAFKVTKLINVENSAYR